MVFDFSKVMSPFSFLTFETSHFSLVSWSKILSVLSELWTEILKAPRASDTQAHCRMLGVSFPPQPASTLPSPAVHLGAVLLFPVHPQPSRSPLLQIFKFSHGTPTPKVVLLIDSVRLLFALTFVIYLGQLQYATALHCFKQMSVRKRWFVLGELLVMLNTCPFWWKIPRNHGEDETIRWD